MDLLNKIQQKLVVKKNRHNKFGNFYYRSCEDILEAVKPLLGENGNVIIHDFVKDVGDRIYVIATASLWEKKSPDQWVKTAESTGYAREEENKKGMDQSQITGSASSYARKSALCGLFGIDDGNDPDKTNKNETDEPKEKPELQPGTKEWGRAVATYKRDKHFDEIEKRMTISDENKELLKKDAENN